MSEIEIPGLPTSYPIPGVRGFPLTGQGVRSPQSRLRLMLVGQKVSMPATQGTQAANATFSIPSAEAGAGSAGYGSSIHRMAADLLRLFPLISLSGCICDPDVAAAQASDTLVLSGAPTESGYVRLRLAGQLLSVPVAAGDSPGTVQMAIDAAIGLPLAGDLPNLSDLPVYAYETEFITYDTGKTISFKPKVADVDVVFVPGTTRSLGVLGTTATITFIQATTTYAEIEGDWNASADAKALADISGVAGTLPVGYAGETLSLNDGTVSLKAKTKGADQNGIKWTCHIEGATGLLVDGGTSASGALTGGTGDSDWDSALDAIIDEDPATYWAILPATCDVTVLTSGVDSLKNRIKLAARPDVRKRMRAILGHTGTEAEAKALSDAWEEGTQDDETGHRGRIVLGMGQTAEPWICAAGYAGMYTRAVATRINKNPAEDPVIETLLVPASKGDGPLRADLIAALNDGLIPLVYDFDRNQTSILRSISAKHSTGGLTDYRARPTVVSDVLDFVNDGLEISLADIYRGFMITDDNPDGTIPDRLPPKTTTPLHIRGKIFYLLKRDYFEPGYIDNVEALLDAMLIQRNGTITSRVDGDISVIARRWLEQIFYILREVGGEA